MLGKWDEIGVICNFLIYLIKIDIEWLLLQLYMDSIFFSFIVLLVLLSNIKLRDN